MFYIVILIVGYVGKGQEKVRDKKHHRRMVLCRLFW